MAPKLNKKQKQALEDLKETFDLGPGYAQILRDAVINDWNDQEIIQAVTHSPTFRRSYPGIFDADGNLADFLVGSERASLSPQTLATAIKNYNTLWKSYEDAAVNYKGIIGRMGRDKVAALIRSETSPDEFATKLQAVYTVKTNPEMFKLFQQQMRAAGLEPLKGQGLFRFIAGTADKKFYDVYEATRFRQALDLKKADANRLAKQVGLPGEQFASLDQVAAEARSQLRTIGPELQAQGINTVKLVKALANPSANLDVMEKVQQILTSRSQLGKPVQGTYPTRGPGGGVSIYEQQGEASYG